MRTGKWLRLSGEYLFWLVLSAAVLFPLGYALLCSFKGKFEFFNSRWWQLPQEWLFSNYATAAHKIQFFELTMNSLFITSGAVFGIVVLASMAGFVLAWFTGRVLNAVANIILLCLMMPLAVGLLPLLLVSSRLGLLDSPFALWGPYIAFNLPLCIYLMKTYYEGIPGSLLEAATVDGAGLVQMFVKIVFPMGLPMMITAGVVSFVKIWGEFMLVLTLIPNPKWWTLGVGVFNYGEMLKFYSYPEMFACTILAVIPSLIVFIICKRVLFSIKITGGLKG